MTAVQVALLAVVIVLQLVAAVGLFVIRDPLDRLHLVGPVSVIGTIVLIVATVLAGTSTTHLAKTIVTGLFLWAASPFVSRTTARALRVRDAGELAIGAVDRDEDDRP